MASKEDFGCLEADNLVLFLKSSTIVVRDEFTLFQLVCQWLEGQAKSNVSSASADATENASSLAQEELVRHVMQNVRFPMMSPRQLATLLLNPLVVRYKEFFVDKMSQAMSFHASSSCSSSSDAMETPGSQPQSSISLSSAAAPFTLKPRLYTTEKWSSSLVIENYRNLPAYGVRTLVFSTPASLKECTDMHDDDLSGQGSSSSKYHEWAIDLYPKGVWFKKFFLIAWREKLEIPESVSKTVRLSLTTTKAALERGKVAIGILIHGQQDGVEHIRKVVRREFFFNKNDRMLNIDDLLDFEELNESWPLTCCSRSEVTRSGPRMAPSPSSSSTSSSSLFLVTNEEGNESLKIQVTITPCSP